MLLYRCRLEHRENKYKKRKHQMIKRKAFMLCFPLALIFGLQLQFAGVYFCL